MAHQTMSQRVKEEEVAGSGWFVLLGAAIGATTTWLASSASLTIAARAGLLPSAYASWRFWWKMREGLRAIKFIFSRGPGFTNVVTQISYLPLWVYFSFTATIAGVFAGTWIGWRAAHRRTERHAGGARIHEGGGRRGTGIALSKKFRLGRRDEVQHILFLAGSGGGKTTLIKRVIRQAIDRGDRLLILDFKRDFSEMLFPRQGGPTLIAPWDSRSSRWQIGEDLRTTVARDEFLLAAIPDGREAQWARGARAIAEAVMTALAAECGAGWGFGDLVASLSAAMADLPAMRGIAATYAPETLLSLDTSPATRTSFLTNIGQALSALARIAAAEAQLPASRTWSVCRWASTPGAVAILGWLPEGQGMSRSLALPAIQTSIIALLSQPDVDPDTRDSTRRTWLVLDEIGQAGHVPALTAGLTAVRSKGGRIVVGLQSLGQVDEHYGRSALQTWLGQLGTKIISRVEAPEDQKTVLDLVGRAEIERWHVTHSRDGGRSEGWQRHEQPAIAAHELAQLGPRRDGRASDVLIIRGGETWRQVVGRDRDDGLKAPALVATNFLRAGYTRPNARTLGHLIDLDRFRALAPPNPDAPKN